MKLATSQQFYAHWDRSRGDHDAPERREMDLDAIRPLLGDSFVIECDWPRDHPFTFAGTRLCALFGRDLKNEAFSTLWNDDTRRAIDDFIHIAEDETVGTLTGLTAPDASGAERHLELLILPFRQEPYAPRRITGTLTSPMAGSLMDMRLAKITTWRHLGPALDRPRATTRERLIRKLNLMPGFWVYEGRGS